MKRRHYCTLALLAAALLAAGCNVEIDSLEKGDGGGVSFGAYLTRPVTRAGDGGILTLDGTAGSLSLQTLGFGVMAYQTGAEPYTPVYRPDFMYNQQVTYNGGEAVWEYTPQLYWPGEGGKVSFFAYAPWVAADPLNGTVTGDTGSGIVALSANNAVGDPYVHYKVNLDPDPDAQVDFCWAAPRKDRSKPVGGSNEHVDMAFRHALASLNIRVDAYVDGTDNTGVMAGETRVWIRSVRFEGFTTQGSFCLNTPADSPVWYDLWHTNLVANDAFTILDGRTDGMEGRSASPNETPLGLNPMLVQSWAYGLPLQDEETARGKTLGVYNDMRNLFDSETSTDPLFVIPTDKPLRVTVAYDIETQASHLPAYLSDGSTHGVSTTNVVSTTVQDGAGNDIYLTPGKTHTVRLHLGLTSVKFNAVVSDWGETASDTELEIPLEELPMNDILLGVAVNPWDQEDDIPVKVPMSELAELFSYFQVSRSGADDVSANYIGRRVDSNGNIQGILGTAYDDANWIGNIAYISTNATSVDASIPTGRILIAYKEALPASVAWGPLGVNTGYTDVSALNGDNFTDNFHAETGYDAAAAAYALGTAFGNNWFLPSKQQMMLIGCRDGVTAGVAGTLHLNEDSWWCATEASADQARCYTGGIWTVANKDGLKKVLPVLAY